MSTYSIERSTAVLNDCNGSDGGNRTNTTGSLSQSLQSVCLSESTAGPRDFIQSDSIRWKTARSTNPRVMISNVSAAMSGLSLHGDKENSASSSNNKSGLVSGMVRSPERMPSSNPVRYSAFHHRPPYYCCQQVNKLASQQQPVAQPSALVKKPQHLAGLGSALPLTAIPSASAPGGGKASTVSALISMFSPAKKAPVDMCVQKYSLHF